MAGEDLTDPSALTCPVDCFGTRHVFQAQTYAANLRSCKAPPIRIKDFRWLRKVQKPSCIKFLLQCFIERLRTCNTSNAEHGNDNSIMSSHVVNAATNPSVTSALTHLSCRREFESSTSLLAIAFAKFIFTPRPEPGSFQKQRLESQNRQVP